MFLLGLIKEELRKAKFQGAVRTHMSSLWLCRGCSFVDSCGCSRASGQRSATGAVDFRSGCHSRSGKGETCDIDCWKKEGWEFQKSMSH